MGVKDFKIEGEEHMNLQYHNIDFLKWEKLFLPIHPNKNNPIGGSSALAVAPLRNVWYEVGTALIYR